MLSAGKVPVHYDTRLASVEVENHRITQLTTDSGDIYRASTAAGCARGAIDYVSNRDTLGNGGRTMNTTPFGFRVVGPTTGERRLIDAAAGLAGSAACDERAHVDREAYLSAFQFDGDFATHLRGAGSVKGWTGSCWSPCLWWDRPPERS